MGRLGALIPLILALAIAVIASVVLYNWVQKRGTGEGQARTVQAETVEVAVAVLDLSWGTKLTPEVLKMTPYLKESIPPGAFTAAKDLAGRILIVPTRKGEPVLESRLAPTTVEQGGVAALIGPGKRALSVKGDKVLGMAGLMRSGSRVDVLATMTNPGAEDDNQKDVTKMVLENVLVLATGTQLEQDAKGATGEVDVYTLEVTPEEAEKLALASAKGRLHFALRNAMDSGPVTTYGATIPTMLALYDPRANYRAPLPTPKVVNVGSSGEVLAPKEEAIPTPPPKPRMLTVEVLKGTDMSKVDFILEK